MALTVTPGIDAVFTKVRAYLLGIVPAGTIVLRGPVDRAAQPESDHIVVTPQMRKRLRTNVYRDVDPNIVPDDGTTQMEEGVQLELLIDCYGDTLAADWAAMVETTFRSEYAVTALAPDCAPLYADEARQVPLVTGEEQYLERWMVRAMLQYNPVTTTPQQFADSVDVNIINVDVEYPP
jgi:hypothetical protein